LLGRKQLEGKLGKLGILGILEDLEFRATFTVRENNVFILSLNYLHFLQKGLKMYFGAKIILFGCDSTDSVGHSAYYSSKYEACDGKFPADSEPQNLDDVITHRIFKEVGPTITNCCNPLSHTCAWGGGGGRGG
jgi:hypothetical protein